MAELIPEPEPKNQPAMKLEQLFTSKPEGFLTTDLKKIVLSDFVFNWVSDNAIGLLQFNPRFIWQVGEFPHPVWYDDDTVPDTILAVARDMNFCAVITMSADMEHIWWRMYKNDVHVPGIFGTLMFAYTQHMEYWEMGRVGHGSIFAVIDENEHYGKMYIENSFYDRNYDKTTYMAISNYADDGVHRGRSIFFVDGPSEAFYKDMSAVEDGDDFFPNDRYPGMMYNEYGMLYVADQSSFEVECFQRPSATKFPWKTTDNALITNITRSIMRGL
jgi:hypothetical protein